MAVRRHTADDCSCVTSVGRFQLHSRNENLGDAPAHQLFGTRSNIFIDLLSLFDVSDESDTVAAVLIIIK